MTTIQAYQLWIGFGFVLLLVGFLIVAFFTKEQLTNDQRQILKFLCALCAGFAGALITGDALFKLDATLGQNTKLAVSGTAGAALFFVIWFGFNPLIFSDATHFSVPPGWTFRQAADALVLQDKSVVEYVGFAQDELAAPLQSRELHAQSMADVSFERPTYRLEVHG